MYSSARQGRDPSVPDVKNCANPTCNKQFLRMGEGCLSVLPVKNSAAWGLPEHAKQKVVWICESCSREFYVRLDRRNYTVQLVHRALRQAA